MRTYLLWALVGVFSLAGCTTPRQQEFDAEVNRLCAIDGGQKIYETVPLAESQMATTGYPIFFKSHQGEQALGPAYAYRQEVVHLRGAPNEMVGAVIQKHMTQVIRKSDGKLLGSDIWYSRAGGDLPLPGHPTAYFCPQSQQHIIKKIFIRE